MTIDELVWIRDLFNTLNMSRSAENLYVTQSALSQCVSRVEKQLGFTLFERSNKGLKPTEKGRMFSETAGKITDEYQNFRNRIYLLDHPALEKITIGMAPFLASICSVDLIRQLNEAYPGISFSVYDSYSADLFSALQAGKIQMIVVNNSLTHPEFTCIPFGKISTVIFLRKGSPAEAHRVTRHGRLYLDPKYLKDEPIAITRQGQASRALAESVYAEAGFTPDIRHESRHVSSLYKYALEGIASSVTVLTGEVRQLDRDTGLVCRLPDTYKTAHTSWQIVMQKETERELPEGLCALVEKAVIDSDTAVN